MPTKSFEVSKSIHAAPQQIWATLMQEGYRGPLAGMMTRQIPDLSGSFEQFGEALKKKAESTGQQAGA